MKQIKKWLAAVCVASMLATAGCSSPAKGSAESSQVQSQEVQTTADVTTAEETTAAALYSPGTYEGTAKGFGGDVVVKITVDAASITDVTAAGEGETPDKGGAAIEKMAGDVLKAQSVDVDGVSGSTISSNAFKEAAGKALNEAMGIVADNAEVKMKPGTYTAYGDGFSLVEKVPVTVTVDETSIQKIEVSEDCAETSIILRNAVELLVPRMLEAQSVRVDAICGATASSSAIKTAAEDCLKQALEAAGTDVSAIERFYTVPAKENEGVKEQLEADVLVIGMGGAGCTAAMSAAEQGLSVIGIEKAGKIGGTSTVTSSPCAVNPEKFQEEFNNGEDYVDKEALREAWLAYTTGADGVQDAKTEVVDLLLDYSGETLDWLRYEHGFSFCEPGTGFTAADVYRVIYDYAQPGIARNDRRIATQSYYEGMMEKFQTLGGRYLTETEGTQLIYDAASGTVQGAYAVAADGTQYEIRAKAVVLATGGFAGSPDMVDQYITGNEYYDFSTTGGWCVYGMYQNDGKMIASAIEIGADTYNITMPPMVHNTANPTILREYEVTPVEGETNIVSGRTATRSLNDIPQIMVSAANILVVGNDGERFVDESNMGMLGSWGNGREFYSIWSTTQLDEVEQNGFKNVKTSNYLGQGGVNVGEPMPRLYEVLDTAMAEGIAYKADTLEELAKQIGVPEDSLKATVEAYNGYCASGVDEQFNKAAEYLDPIGEGPYYCIVGSPYCYATVGGLNINADCNVLNTDGEEIHGLYAVGEDSLGCLMTDEKAYVTFGAAAEGWAVTSGYCVGRVLGERLK